MIDVALPNDRLDTPLDDPAPATENGAPESQPPQPSGRDANGRFAAGNPGGPGNPFGRRTAAFRQAFANAIEPEDIHALARELYAKAKAGDLGAAKLVLSYTLGKPVPATEPDRLDVQEYKLFQEASILPEPFNQVTKAALPPSLGLPVMRVVWSLKAQKMFDAMMEGLSKPYTSPDDDDDDEEEEPSAVQTRTSEPKAATPQPEKDRQQTVQTASEPRTTAANGNGRQARKSTSESSILLPKALRDRVHGRQQTVQTVQGTSPRHKGDQVPVSGTNGRG